MSDVIMAIKSKVDDLWIRDAITSEEHDMLREQIATLRAQLSEARERLAEIEAQEPVADDVVRDYPEGWVFHSADFSMNASCPARSGRVTLVRDLSGRDWWFSLSGKDKERVPLYVFGSGDTLSDAIKDAALLAAQQQKAGGA